MTKQEMRTKFADLYSTMANSGKVENMKIFGSVMKEMMDYFIEEYPDDAESYIESLEAVKWNNYLTKDEAECILEKMKPTAPWDYDTFVNAVQRIGGEIEHKHCYNSHALWVVMNMIYSDSSETLASIMGGSVDNIPIENMVKAVYLLAQDKLKDEDENFSVRSYFGV